MPTYEHICMNEECQYEWEDEYSIKDDPPQLCPKCGKNTAKRLISGGSGKGKVELYGRELSEKLKDDTQKLKKELATNETLRANFYGETKYNSNISHNEKKVRELGYISNHFRRVKK
jgi:putative FmdB family regulatory protein